MPPEAKLHLGDCRKVLNTLKAGSVDAVVTDPPYGLSFMGKDWDHGVPGIPYWSRVLRVLKPGGYLLSFGGTRTYHRLACAIEDTGFEIRDCLMWVYGSGFPKGQGCLKPAWEPVLLARKPGKGILPLGIDECRIGVDEPLVRPAIERTTNVVFGKGLGVGRQIEPSGRYPANVVHDGSEEVLEAFAEYGERTTHPGKLRNDQTCDSGAGYGSIQRKKAGTVLSNGDGGTAARFFYAAKASKAERGEDNTHPTVKPLALMKWLVNLVSKEEDTVLDPFMGSGTTGKACRRLFRKFIGIDNDEESYNIACKRLKVRG